MEKITVAFDNGTALITSITAEIALVWYTDPSRNIAVHVPLSPKEAKEQAYPSSFNLFGKPFTVSGVLSHTVDSARTQRAYDISVPGRPWLEMNTIVTLQSELASKIDFDEVLTSYINCALWTEQSADGYSLDEEYTAADVAPTSNLAQLEEVVAWLRYCDKLGLIDPMTAADSEVNSSLGYDFWLTRNGYGEASWNRTVEHPIATALTDAAKTYGSCSIAVGENNLLVFT